MSCVRVIEGVVAPLRFLRIVNKFGEKPMVSNRVCMKLFENEILLED